MILGWQFLTILGSFWHGHHPELRFEQLVDYIKMNGAIKNNKDPFEWTNDDWVEAINTCIRKETENG